MQNILIKDPSLSVLQSIESLSLSYPSLSQLSVNLTPLPILFRSDWLTSHHSKTHVALITGGGAGHEPAHAFYVGPGMLTAAVSGQIFASPSVQLIYDTIDALIDKEGPGCLLIVKNYTGDRLNFGLAAEQAKSKGLKVKLLIVEDDCSLDKEKGVTGRRGIAGTVLIHKIAGALADDKLSLDVIYEKLYKILGGIKTIGVGFSSCAIPGRISENRIKEGYMELGLGIHNEPGVETCQYKGLEDLVERMMEKIVKEYEGFNEKRYVVLVNNLGSFTCMEMGLIVREINLWFDRKLKKGGIIRLYAGSYMTSFDMKGFSISLLGIEKENEEEYLGYLDHKVNTVGWANYSFEGGIESRCYNFSREVDAADIKEKEVNKTDTDEKLVGRVLETIAKKLLSKETELNDLDAKVGDGDCGSTFALGAKQILNDIKGYPLNNISNTLKSLTKSIENSMGGTSGVIYRIFFTALAHNYHIANDQNTLKKWKFALEGALSALLIYDKAREGHRTMLDALIPAIRAFGEAVDKGEEVKGCLKTAMDHAIKGAEATKGMKGAAGRSNYVPEEILKLCEDPGARAIAYIVEGIFEGVN